MASEHVVVKYNHADKIRKEVMDKLEAVVARTAFKVEAGAKHRAPVATGFLRNSIRATKEDAETWLVSANAEYASYVEHGTRYAAAQPFMLPAIEAEKNEFYAMIERVL